VIYIILNEPVRKPAFNSPEDLYEKALARRTCWYRINVADSRLSPSCLYRRQRRPRGK
ncbi:MAG: hypothetical protein ACI83P_001254, partial [Janthinobacterium sp.]